MENTKKMKQTFNRKEVIELLTKLMYEVKHHYSQNELQVKFPLKEWIEDFIDNPIDVFKIIMINPPEGWKYKFPKCLPKEMPMTEMIEWIIEQGYPRELVESYGDSFRIQITELK